MKNIYILLVLFFSLVFLYSCGQQTTVAPNGVNNTSTSNQGDSVNANVSTDSNSNNVSLNTAVPTLGKNVIEITATGFNPNSLTINAGDRVDFINKDTLPHWPASDPHPIHDGYPGSGIDKCGTPEQVNIFDACKGLNQNEIFSFVFKEKGTWGFHDHMNHGVRGTITVN